MRRKKSLSPDLAQDPWKNRLQDPPMVPQPRLVQVMPIQPTRPMLR
jgi:hypothetical protein